MSDTSDFKADPETFLKTTVVIADSTSATGAVGVTRKKFVLKREKGNLCTLRMAGIGSKDFIEAYWLPWKKDDRTSGELGGEAEFFFTSEMSNCRFSVLSEGTTPRVAHIAGNTSPGHRNTMEAKVFDKEEVKRLRRMSISGAALHGYRGTNPEKESDKSSAFVFGRLQADKTWKFYAQISEGFMDGGMFMKEFKGDVKILQPCISI